MLLPPLPLISRPDQELWPGSHLDISPSSDEDAVAARRAIAPPVPNLLPKGAVSVRDFRLWHRGVPNTAARPRHMIAISFSRPTTANRPKEGKTHAGGGTNGRFLFNADCASAFDRSWWPPAAPASLVDHNVEFTEQTAEGALSAVDHFGNLPGSFAGEGNDRNNFWLPSEPVAVAADAPRWVREAARLWPAGARL